MKIIIKKISIFNALIPHLIRLEIEFNDILIKIKIKLIYRKMDIISMNKPATPNFESDIFDHTSIHIHC